MTASDKLATKLAWNSISSPACVGGLPLQVERPFNALSELLLRDSAGAAKKLDATPAPVTPTPAAKAPQSLADVELKPFEETKMEAR